jgi:hypothetical protein
MNNDIERNLGEQPMSVLMSKYKLMPHDLVCASTEQITHKMVSRAAKGRRLTPHLQVKILNAFNKASGKNFSLCDLFNYT